MITRTTNRNQGLTLLDVLLALALVFGLAIILLPNTCGTSKKAARRIQCLSNLKQIGVAFQMWAGDHSKRFPWEHADGGTPGLTDNINLLAQFLVISNELSNPKILRCPSDGANRDWVTNFSELRASSLSYFLCPDVQMAGPLIVLSGDRNISGGKLSNGVRTLSTHGTKAGWSEGVHSPLGHVLLSNGGAQAVSARDLNQKLQALSVPEIRLLIP